MDQVTAMTSAYCENSQTQKNATLYTSSILKSEILEMAEAYPDRFRDLTLPFTIADLGCADGLNSIENLKVCIKTVRSINVNLPITIYLEDTPANDFELTSKNIEERLRGYDNIDFCYIAKSFYEPLFPNESLDVMFSNTSVHWIRRVPCPHEDFVFIDDGKYPNDEIANQWRNAGKEDWNTFLDLREKELRKSGFIIACTQAVTRTEELDQPFIKTTNYILESLNELLIKYNLVDNKIDFIMPAIWRDEDSVTLPFNKERPLKLKLYQKRRVDWLNHNNEVSESEHEIDKFARKFTNFYEAVTGSMLRAGLQKHIKDADRIDYLYKEFYDTYHKKNIDHIDVLKTMESITYFYITAFKS